MRRILVLLSVVALMVVMLAMSVAPANADQFFSYGQCHKRISQGSGVPGFPDDHSDFNAAANPFKSQGNQPGSNTECLKPHKV